MVTPIEPESGAAREMGTSLDGPQPGVGHAKEPEKTPQPKSADRDLGLRGVSGEGSADRAGYDITMRM